MQLKGMMWFSMDKKTTFTEKLLAGADYFRNKYQISGKLLCQVKEIPEGFEPLETIEVSTSKSILPHHFWIGVDSNSEKNSYGVGGL